MIYDHYSDFPPRMWRWPSFSPREMASKREGELMIDADAMDKLQALRDKLGVPLVVVSAYRSPAHNAAVGGARNSYHMQAKAFDIAMTNHDPWVFEAAAREVGFTGFGFYRKNGFMHIDTGPAREWGARWPKTETRLPVEPVRKPETVKEDREAQAAAGAGAAGAVAVAVDALPAAGGLLGQLAPTAQTIAVIVAAVLIGYLIWRRVR